MVVDERSRHQLYRRLEEVLGAEAATTLIEHLPPAGWSEVAMKADLTALEERMNSRFARVDDRFSALEERMSTGFARVDDRFVGLEERMEIRFDAMDDRMKGSSADLRATFEHELRSQTMALIFGMVSVVLTMAMLAFALVRFT